MQRTSCIDIDDIDGWVSRFAAERRLPMAPFLMKVSGEQLPLGLRGVVGASLYCIIMASRDEMKLA